MKKTRRIPPAKLFQSVRRDDLARRLIDALRGEIASWGPDAAARCAAGADADLWRLFDAFDRTVNFPLFRHVPIEDISRREVRR